MYTTGKTLKVESRIFLDKQHIFCFVSFCVFGLCRLKDLRPVINYIPLIGQNYSIQTGVNFSTNASTQIYHRSHSL